jgi:diguanylate cyclase (GGDEF)-like protein
MYAHGDMAVFMCNTGFNFQIATNSMSSSPPAISIDVEPLRKPLVSRAVALISCICIVLIGLNVSSLIASYKSELAESRTSTANMARALASHAERSIKIGDAVLGEMVERAEYGQHDNTSLERLHGRMAEVALATPELQELFLYDRDGNRLVTSLPKILAGSNADREFFRYHKAHADLTTHVGNPIRSRSSGVLTIPLSRRVNLPDGSFGGVAMASLSLASFGKFYDSFDVGKTGTILMATDNGTLLYRRPFLESNVGLSIGDGVLFQHYRKTGPVGTAMLVPKIDGIERMYSYRHLDGAPLLVAIAQTRTEILSDWWQSLIKTSCIVVVAMAILILGARRMMGQLRERDALEQELRRARAITESHNVALQALANTDSLTGLANRRHFEKTLGKEQERARRNGKPCSLIMGDVDFFKKYNDHYGHVAGDACLRQVADAIAGTLRRPADVAARYGGEEFVVILPETGAAGAAAVAQNIRARIHAASIAHADSAFGHVTISLGVYTGHAALDNANPADWVEAADVLLYQAKAAGRDRMAAGEQAQQDDGEAVNSEAGLMRAVG